MSIPPIALLPQGSPAYPEAGLLLFGNCARTIGPQTPLPLPAFYCYWTSRNQNQSLQSLQGVTTMRYLHTMLRVRNLDAALKFYQDALGLKEVRRIDNDKAKFTLVFLCAAEDEHLLKNTPKTRGAPLVELTYNWDEEKYGEDRYFGHLAYEV